MSQIILRAGKGSALTHNELDANFKKAAQTKAGAYTIAETDNRDTIEYSGAGAESFTMPDTATVVAAADTGDFEVTIKHVGSGVLTVTCLTGTDTIDGSTNDFTLDPNDTITLKSIQAGTGYNIISGATLNGVTRTNTATLTNKTLTTPIIAAIKGVLGLVVAKFVDVASAVNDITFTNAASGNKPSLNQTGTDDVGIDIEGVTLHNGLIESASVGVAAGSFASDVGYRELLSTATASTSATIDFTGLDSTYELYEVEMINIDPDTDNTALRARVQTGGSTWETGSVYTDTASATENYIDIAIAMSNLSNTGGFCGYSSLYNPASTSVHTALYADGVYTAAATGYTVTNSQSGKYNQTTAVTGLRFYMSTGNIEAGEFRLYGVK